MIGVCRCGTANLNAFWRHPERSRFTGGAKDLARSGYAADALHARSLDPLEKARVFGMTPSGTDQPVSKQYSSDGRFSRSGRTMRNFAARLGVSLHVGFCSFARRT